MIVADFILANTSPVQGIGCRCCGWMLFCYLLVSVLSFSPILLHESDPAEGQVELSREFWPGKVSLESLSFFASGVED